MIDLQEKLRETIQAIDLLKQSGQAVPDRVFELNEILQRCVDAESALDAIRNSDGAAAKMRLDREAYEAYCRHTNWKSLVTGEDLPQWDALPDAIRVAWRVSTARVIDQTLRRFDVWIRR